ncbi:hypothetical protein EVG20_g7022 [Dentipellis fragilis]|uniref:BTB domain-containing protein n=1 Tax=Dentipellis fragilis TaxID=205917 RepID=A0A4Y9YHR1_9AGAM|nr:hypothetical protein EVG20_g7022 [Dentipellis fragilis]
MDHLENYRHHEDLYYTDGNVVLVVQWPDEDEPDRHVVFRVHRSILSRSSPVFQDMFSLPEGEAPELYDGVPLIRMHDSGGALESLLRYLYSNPTPFYLKPFDPETPLKVRPLLAMADKYQVEALRKLIVEQLEADWPQTLSKWDQVLDSDRCMDTGDAYLDDLLPEPASAIRLARDFDIPTILGPAFYHLSRIDISRDWDNYRALDARGRQKRAWLPRDSDAHRVRTARWSLLGKEDYISLLRGRYFLREAAELVVVMLRLPSAIQGEPHLCSADCNSRMYSKALNIRHQELLASTDILHDLQLAANEEWLNKGRAVLCSRCHSSIITILSRYRQNVWDKLNLYFVAEDLLDVEVGL